MDFTSFLRRPSLRISLDFPLVLVARINYLLIDGTTWNLLHNKKLIVVSSSIAFLVLFVLLAPVIPLGSYGFHAPPLSVNPTYVSAPQNRLPRSVFEQTACAHTLCPVTTLNGQSYVSISYSSLGAGGYLFIEDHQRFCWAFVW